MFNEITMIDYSRSLIERMAARRFVGPYKWRPTTNSGRGFYQASKGLSCDQYGDTTLTPIIARLPHGRGFLAGWTMGEGMAASLDSFIHDDAESAARAAHSEAEYWAEVCYSAGFKADAPDLVHEFEAMA